MKNFFNYVKTTNQFSLYTILLFCILWLLNTSVDTSFAPALIAIVGLVLFLYIPGKHLNDILGINKDLDLIPRISFSIASSLVVIGFSYLLTRVFLGFGQTSNIIMILVVNIVLYVLNYFFKTGKTSEKTTTESKFNYFSLIALIPAVLFIIRSIINPYLVDQDGEKYIFIMNKIVEYKVDSSFLSAARYLFSELVVGLHYITGINFLNIFKFVFPLATWLTFPVILALFNKSKNKILYSLPLLVMISPSLSGHIDRFKPESIILMIAIPAIVLFVLAVKKNSIKFFIFGLVYALIATRCHETGVLFAGAYLLGGITLIKNNWVTLKSFFSFQRIVWAIVIIIPYLILLHPEKIIGSFYNTVIAIGNIERPLHFRAWFLDHFISQGANLSWPGYSFIIYYLFNGIAITALALIAIFSKKDRQSKATMLPAIIGLGIFLVITEILPRIGVFFLPDRAIVQLFLYAFIIVIISSIYSPNFMKLLSNKIVLSLLVINIIGGAAVAFVLQAQAGSLVSREESSLIQKMRSSTETNAVILSTQKLNAAMVEIYSGREFVPISLPDDLKTSNSNLDEIRTEIMNQIEAKNITLTNKNVPNRVIVTSTTNKTTSFDAFFDGSYMLTIDDVHTSENSKKTLPNPDQTIRNRPIYLLYSFTKNNGFLQKVGRAYLSNSIDSGSNAIFEKISHDSETFFEDNAGILIKLN